MQLWNAGLFLEAHQVVESYESALANQKQLDDTEADKVMLVAALEAMPNLRTIRTAGPGLDDSMYHRDERQLIRDSEIRESNHSGTGMPILRFVDSDWPTFFAFKVLQTISCTNQRTYLHSGQTKSQKCDCRYPICRVAQSDIPLP